MSVLFQQSLPECTAGDWIVTDCQIQHPRYKTYLNPNSRYKSFLSLAYHLKVRPQHSKHTETRIFYAQAFLGNRSHTEYARAASAIDQDPRRSVLHLPELGLIGWLFPADPALPQLLRLTDPAYMQQFFTHADFIEANLRPEKITKVSIALSNYRPEIRCTQRYILTFSSNDKLTVFGKTFAYDGSNIYRRMQKLWQRSRQLRNVFVIPEPLAYEDSLHTLWLEGLHGRLLLDIIDHTNQTRLFKAITHYLVDFHHATISDLKTVNTQNQTAEIQKKALKLIHAFPQMKNQIAGILTTLEQHQSELLNTPACLIHGDFHLQQLLWLNNYRIALFDFDELALGDPLQDLANFCADLHNLNFTAGRVQKLTHLVFEAYQSESDRKITPVQFNWHLQVQYLTRAYRVYIQQQPQQTQRVKRFIDLAGEGMNMSASISIKH